MVHHPVDYARVVNRIGNEMDLTLVDLDDILPAATVMVVTVTGTTTSGKPLSAENLRKAIDGCSMALALDEDKKLVLQFVESKMHKIAPNLSLVCGSEVAARLMGVAGGLVALSKMPSCNVQVGQQSQGALSMRRRGAEGCGNRCTHLLPSSRTPCLYLKLLGAKRKSLVGLSTATAQSHQGFVVQCSIIQQTPPALRLKAMRLVASKCALLARVDAYGQDPLVRGGGGVFVLEVV